MLKWQLYYKEKARRFAVLFDIKSVDKGAFSGFFSIFGTGYKLLLFGAGEDEYRQRHDKRNEFGCRGCQPKPRHLPQIWEEVCNRNDCHKTSQNGYELGIAALIGRWKVIWKQQIEAGEQRRDEEQSHSERGGVLQLFYALRVEDACNSVRPEEYCNIQHDGNGGDGDEGVAQYATDFWWSLCP